MLRDFQVYIRRKYSHDILRLSPVSRFQWIGHLQRFERMLFLAQLVFQSSLGVNTVTNSIHLCLLSDKSYEVPGFHFIFIFIDYAFYWLLQLSHFPPFTPLCPAYLPCPHSHSLVHVCESYTRVLWLLHFPYHSHSPPVYSLPTIYATYSLYLFPPLSLSHSSAENPPCDLHFCGSVPVLVVCLVCFCFCFRCGC